MTCRARNLFKMFVVHACCSNNVHNAGLRGKRADVRAKELREKEKTLAVAQDKSAAMLQDITASTAKAEKKKEAAGARAKADLRVWILCPRSISTLEGSRVASYMEGLLRIPPRTGLPPRGGRPLPLLLRTIFRLDDRVAAGLGLGSADCVRRRGPAGAHSARRAV